LRIRRLKEMSRSIKIRGPRKEGAQDKTGEKDPASELLSSGTLAAYSNKPVMFCCAFPDWLT
jgi:hypothetical protein